MNELQECTTWSHKKRHLSANLGAGDQGQTLCWETAWSQEEFDRRDPRWWYGSWPVERIADLPMCKRCEQVAAKL